MTKSKPRIAIFHCGFIYSGGGERIVLEEAKGLKKRGYRVEVFAPNIDPETCFPEFLKSLKVKTFLPQLPRWFPFRDGILMIVTSFLAPCFFYRFKKTDIFFGANQPGAWLAFCLSKLLGKPYLVYLNQPNRLVYPRKIDQQTGWQTRRDYYLLAKIINYFKPLATLLDRLSFTKSQAMLVNGDYIGRIIQKIYTKEVIMASAGSYFQPLSKLRLNPTSAYRGQFSLNGIKIKKPYILITNRHEPQKRFDYVIKAFKLVLKKCPQAFLVIPGPFTLYTPKLIKLSKDLGILPKIIFTNQVTENQLQRLYQEAAVYCYPSPDEDFGLGPLEAGGWGVPTVAWKHGGPTVTVDDGVSGFLAEPYQIDDYAAKITLLLKDKQLRAKMGKAAWMRTKTKFSWEKHLDILEREIRKISNLNPSTPSITLRINPLRTRIQKSKK